MIAKQLDLLMIQNNLTNTALSTAIGVSDVTIGFWRKGKKEPTASKINLLAQYFHVTTDYLLGLEGSNLSPNRQKLTQLANTLSDDQIDVLLKMADTWSE